MSERDQDPKSGDDTFAEELTLLMEHVEQLEKQRLSSGRGWELSEPAADLDDAPIPLGDDQPKVPDLDVVVEVAEDIEMFTDTELDLNRRISQVEDEQLELTAALTAEKARWEKRVDSLQMDLAERNQLLAGREAEIEEISAELSSMTLERDGISAELRQLKHVAGIAAAAPPPPAPASTIGPGDSLRLRLRERGAALLVAREEIDRLRADREQLVAGLAERGEFIQRLHERLRALEQGRRGDGEIRKLLRRFFGGERPEQAPAAGARPALAEPAILDDPSPRSILIEGPERPAPREVERAIPRGSARLRRYLIGLDLVGRVHEISQSRISVGRTQENELRIVDPTISRLHAVLRVHGNDVTVIDANSRNGVYVNEILVRHARLNDGDLLTFGTVRFRYRIGSGSTGGG